MGSKTDRNDDDNGEPEDGEPRSSDDRETTKPSSDNTDEEDAIANNDPDATGTGPSKRKRKRKRKRKTTSDADDHDDDNADGDDKTNNNKNDDEGVVDDQVERTVFVEGIPFDATPDDVKTFFVTNGVEDVVELRLPTWQDSGRLRGFGHIKLGTLSSYEVALKELNGKYMGKRYLSIQPANAPSSHVTSSTSSSSFKSPPTDCHTLFLANLPYSATESDILDAIQKAVPEVSFPSIADNADAVNTAGQFVRIAKNSVTHQSKGFGYLDLPSSDDATKVMKSASKRPIRVSGRIVRLDYDTPNGRIKGSFRSDSGRLWTKEQRERERSSSNHRSNSSRGSSSGGGGGGGNWQQKRRRW